MYKILKYIANGDENSSIFCLLLVLVDVVILKLTNMF